MSRISPTNANATIVPTPKAFVLKVFKLKSFNPYYPTASVPLSWTADMATTRWVPLRTSPTRLRFFWSQGDTVISEDPWTM